MKFVMFDRPTRGGSVQDRDEYLEEGADEAAIAASAAKRVAVNPYNVSMVLSTDDPQVSIIRGADGREGIKVVGSYESVVQALETANG